MSVGPGYPDQGERVVGRVLSIPESGKADGNSVVLELRSGAVRKLHATARRGATVLGRELERQAVSPGDWIEIVFRGWRTSEADHRYRDYSVTPLDANDAREGEPEPVEMFA